MNLLQLAVQVFTFVLSPFSDLKELISRKRNKTKTKPYFLRSLSFQNMKLQKCITQES